MPIMTDPGPYRQDGETTHGTTELPRCGRELRID